MQMCVCGAANTDEAKYCSACGKKLEPPLPRCRNCNAELLPGAGFCTGCGTAVDDAQLEAAKAVAAKPSEPIPSPSLFFDGFKYIFKPVTSEEQAKAMAQVGAAAAALVALYMGFSGLLILGGGATVILLQYGQVAIHAVCAWAIMRGYTLGGVVSLVLHLINLYSAYTLVSGSALAASVSVGEAFLLFLVVVVVPVGLVTGIRGCLAWNRFKRQGAA